MSDPRFTQVYKTVAFSSFRVAATAQAALAEYEKTLLVMSARMSDDKYWQEALADVRQAIADFDNGRFA